jgi:hypothetical protein
MPLAALSQVPAYCISDYLHLSPSKRDPVTQDG